MKLHLVPAQAPKRLTSAELYAEADALEARARELRSDGDARLAEELERSVREAKKP